MTENDLRIQSFISSQILGDGCLENNTIRLSHCLQQSDYLAMKVSLAQQLGLIATEIKPTSSVSTLGPQTVVRSRIKIPGEYVFPKSLKELVFTLDSLGLLLWWLDDGSLTIHEKRDRSSVTRFGYLCTENLNMADNVFLSQLLFEKFGLYTRIHVDSSGPNDLVPGGIYYRQYLPATTMRNLIDIVRPWLYLVPVSMLYKLNMDYRPNRMSISFEYSQKYNF